jgi:hypothetical protein
MPRAAWALVGLAALVRGLVAARTAVLDRDSVTYLWMAQEAAAGRIEAAFSTVFHPLYPLLVAPVVPLIGDVEVAGQLVACACGAFAVLPLYALARRIAGDTAAIAAGALYALGIWFARHPADALSEGPFYLFAAAALAALARDRPRAFVAGGLAGLAYGARPEGAALLLLGAPWLWSRGARAPALRFVVVGIASASVWPLGWALLGEGFTLTPKAAFNYAVGVGDPGSDALAHYLTHLLRVPGALFEAIGYVALPLALLGVARLRPRWRDPAALALALVALQVAVVPLLRSNIRFLSGYGMLLLPFAGAAIAALLPRVRRWPLPAQLALAFTVVAGDLVRLPQTRRAERRIERELGEHLRGLLAPGEGIATDMPRLAFHAGLRPPEPRPIPPAEVLALAEQPATRFVAVVAGRTAVDGAEIAALGFAPATLRGPLAAAAAARGIEVFVRRGR